MNDPLTFICVPRNQARSFIPHGMADSMVSDTSFPHFYYCYVLFYITPHDNTPLLHDFSVGWYNTDWGAGCSQLATI